MYSRRVDCPPIYVYSSHPLALGVIQKPLTSAMYEVKILGHVSAKPAEIQDGILILDTCSVNNWPKIARQCCSMGGRSIVLIPANGWTYEQESRLIYLGIHGIVLMANLDAELLRAVQTVAKGGFWLRREALTAHIKRTRSSSNFIESCNFTSREEQIVPLLMAGTPNKAIAYALQISDRTVKFHVSNILRKFKVKDRKALWEFTEASLPKRSVA